MKTHLPVGSLVFSPKAKYIYVARDGRDAIWSAYNHHANHSEWVYELVNSLLQREDRPFQRPDVDVRQYYHEWLDGDGYPMWPFWSHIRSWWEIRDLPNVLLLHFNNLKADLPGEMRRIAKFLDIDVDGALWPLLVEHCTFDYMKAHASELSAHFDQIYKGGSKTFINRGTNGRWRDVLTYSDIQKYEKVARESLSSDCAHWLATGEMSERRTRV